ncbi:MAG: hypothetical protein IMZ53_14495, partial [Thermoplasmata archaeon]|nr:hypothetical protein [Thermoplasmata archaeon]
YNGYMEDYLPDGLNYVPDSTNIILYYGGNPYQNISGSECEPYITDHEGYVTLRWDSQNGYAEILPATGEVYISYRVEVMDTGTFVNVANGTGYTDAQIPVNDQGNATVVVPFVEPTHSISGTVYYEDIPESQLIIAYFDEEPTGQDPTGAIVISDPLEFPIPYTIPDLVDDTYYVFAFIDHDNDMGPPQPDEPIGNAINNTVAEGFDPIVVNGSDVTGADITLLMPEVNNPPVIDITYPEDDDWFNYTNAGALTITGIAYDQDTYVDEVQVTLSYVDEFADTYYYNMSGWSLTPFYYTVGGTGNGTWSDPLVWELIVVPAFPIDYYLYDVYATVYDHDAIPLMNSDANWFWYPEIPVENNPPYMPSNPVPADMATDVPVGWLDLHWDSGDIDDGDTVMYDIYFGTDTDPPFILSTGPYNGTVTTIFYNDFFDVAAGTTYYWQIIAWDNHDASAEGPIWSFTTEEEPQNLPPNIPAIVSPADGATDVSVDTYLTWTCTDPDPMDILHYTVRFDYLNPPANHASNIINTTYDPGTIAYDQIYYWQIVAFDNHGNYTEGPIWNFTTGSAPNNPPNTPTTPAPANGTTNVPINTQLSWTGGDPDLGDIVSYDIYFGTTNPPGKIIGNQSATTYNPGTLTNSTQYYWKIVAWDNHGASTVGPIWIFTTIEELKTKIGIIASSNTVSVGDTFTATVYIDPTTRVGGWEIYLLKFSEDCVSAKSVAIGPIWASGGIYDPGVIHNDTGNINDIQSTKFSVNPDDYPNINHTACTISFTATNAGICTLQLVTVEVTDFDFNLLELRTYNATLTIQ